MSKEATKQAVVTGTESAVLNNGHAVPPTHDQIALLAYENWQQRGCPEGCPDEDWLKAEQELTASK